MDPMLITFGILFLVVAVQLVALIFVFIKTPAGVFLKASMLKQSVLYIMDKDKTAKFITFKSRNGAAIAGKDGVFGLTEDSATMERVSKVSLYFAFRDLAATMDPMYPAIIQELNEQGLAIDNFQDIEVLLDKIEQGLEENFPVKVRSFKTYKMHGLSNMFPFNADPSFVDATIQNEISEGLKMMKATPMFVGGVITLLMVSAVAVYILRLAFKGTITAEECQAMVSAAKCAVSSGASLITNGAT